MEEVEYSNPNQIHTVTKPLVDLQLAITLIVVELPLELLFFWITNRFLQSTREIKDTAEALKQALDASQDRERRIKRDEQKIQELNGFIKNHQNADLIPIISTWFDTPAERTRYSFSGQGQTFVQYAIRTASVSYLSDDGIRLEPLSEPKRYSSSERSNVECTLEHLRQYTQEWEQWIALKTRVDAHLNDVKETWTEIEQDLQRAIEAKCPELTALHILRETEWPKENYYHLRQLIIRLWSDEALGRKEEGSMWDINDLNTLWLNCSADTAKKIREILTEIFNKHQIPDKNEKFAQKEAALKQEADQFEAFLNRIMESYRSIHELVKHACSRCQGWVNEVNSLTVNSPASS